MSRHRLRFFPAFVAMAVLGVGAAAVWLYATWDYGPLTGRLVAPVATIVVVVPAVVAAIAAWIMWRFMDTAVSTEGIRGWTIYNTRRLIRWDEIEDGAVSKLPLFPFLRIRSAAGGPSIWQPLLLADSARFAEAVIAGGGPQHPLARALEQRDVVPA